MGIAIIMSRDSPKRVCVILRCCYTDFSKKSVNLALNGCLAVATVFSWLAVAVPRVASLAKISSVSDL